jgi:hypothetical protein
MTADLSQAEIQRLRTLASKGSGIGLRALEQMLKEARTAAARRAEQEKRERQMAERNDPRPHVPAPADNAEWLPLMQTLNEVIGTSKAAIPPLRSSNRGCTEFPPSPCQACPSYQRKESINDRHPDPTARPEQLLLVTMSEEEVAEMIERHIEFYEETKDGYRSVHLPKKFVRHFMTRNDNALPIATTVAQLPVVLHNTASRRPRPASPLRHRLSSPRADADHAETRGVVARDGRRGDALSVRGMAG